MDFSIASILALDGVTNGAVYALLALATVLLFTITRVIFIPQGEFVAFGALTLAMLQASYAAIVRIGRRFEAVCPAEGNTDDAVTALGKLEDLYEQCVSELEDAKAGLDECRENGFQDDLAYGELMVTKLGLTQLTKQFDIATGYAEPDPEPYQYRPKTDEPAQ